LGKNRAPKYDEHKLIAREFFYDLPVDGVHGSLSFMINAVARSVPFTMSTTPECKLS